MLGEGERGRARHNGGAGLPPDSRQPIRRRGRWVGGLLAVVAAILACLHLERRGAGTDPGRGRLPEGHAGRQHAEPDGARRRPGRARLLHRARRAPDGLEAEHAADRSRRARCRSRRSQENGLLGLQLAPDFAFSKWVYLFYSQLPGQHAHAGRLALQDGRRHARPLVRAEGADVHAPDRAVLPLLRLALLRPGRQPLHLHAATTRTRSTPTASTRSTSRPAASTGTRSARRPTPTTSTARSCGSSRWRSRPARPASARRTRSRPATSSTRRRTRPTRPGRRSSAWASATRSASPSTRRRAGS